MSKISVIEVKEFELLQSIIEDYFIESNIPQEDRPTRLEGFKKHFKREDILYFLANSNEEPMGFLSVEINKEYIHSHYTFIKQHEMSSKILFHLVSETTKQLKKLNKHVMLIYFVNDLNLKNQLLDDGFAVYTRAKMTLDLTDYQVPDLSLHPNYTTRKFTNDIIDEGLQVIMKANQNHIDGEMFYQFTNLECLKDFFLKSKMDTEQRRNYSPILLKDGENVGVNLISKISDKASYVWVIALLKEHQGKGLGKYLMLKAHESCIKAGNEKIILDVTVDNKAAFGLYKKLGYEVNFRYLTVVKKY